MVHGLGEYQSRRAATRRSWYDWLERPETVSALTVLAAVHVLGPEGAAEVLFEGGGDAAAEDAALVDLRARLAEVEGQLATQRRESNELRRQVEDLAGRGQELG
jgi:hypothetical protein